MISSDEMTEIGRVLKTHGIHGEMNIECDIEPDAVKCLFFDMNGILVPFFIDTCRPRGTQSYLVKLDGCESENDAAEFVGKTIFVEDSELDELDDDEDDDDRVYLDTFIGYEIVDTDNQVIGRIIDVDDTTANVLFVVEREDESTIFIPVAEEFFVTIDNKGERVTLDLPKGLIEL